jgi:hypothetical protein
LVLSSFHTFRKKNKQAKIVSGVGSYYIQLNHKITVALSRSSWGRKYLWKSIENHAVLLTVT